MYDGPSEVWASSTTMHDARLSQSYDFFSNTPASSLATVATTTCSPCSACSASNEARSRLIVSRRRGPLARQSSLHVSTACSQSSSVWATHRIGEPSFAGFHRVDQRFDRHARLSGAGRQ